MAQVAENPAQNRNTTPDTGSSVKNCGTTEFCNTAHYDFALLSITAILITLYLIANIMATRVIAIGEMTLFDAGTITFPFTYILGDTLTEIWGYKTAKRVIILAFLANILLTAFTWAGSLLPYPAYNADIVTAYNTLFCYVPRIVLGSLIAFLCGELTNAKIMAYIKERFGVKHLWFRAIMSSVAGYAVDSVVFPVIAFGGTIPVSEIVNMAVFQYIAKLAMDICCTPFTYMSVAFLRKRTYEKNTKKNVRRERNSLFGTSP